MAFTLCKHMVVDKSKVKMDILTNSSGESAMKVRATVSGLLTVETRMVLDSTSIVGSNIVANFRLLAENDKHNGTTQRCSEPGTSDYLILPAGGTYKANITYDGGTLSLILSEAGDCGGGN